MNPQRIDSDPAGYEPVFTDPSEKHPCNLCHLGGNHPDPEEIKAPLCLSSKCLAGTRPGGRGVHYVKVQP